MNSLSVFSLENGNPKQKKVGSNKEGKNFEEHPRNVLWNVSGTIPEPFRKTHQKFDSGYNTEYIRIHLVFWGKFLYSDTFPTHFTHVKDDFLMNPLIQSKSGTTPVMSRNAFSTNQGTNEDDPQSDPHPEAGIFGNQTMQNSGQKDRRDS